MDDQSTIGQPRPVPHGLDDLERELRDLDVELDIDIDDGTRGSGRGSHEPDGRDFDLDDDEFGTPSLEDLEREFREDMIDELRTLEADLN